MKLIYTTSAGVESHIIDQHITHLASYLAHCRDVVAQRTYDADEASLCLVADAKSMQEMQQLVTKKKSHHLKYIIVIGIGGSNLGTKAIYDALYREAVPKILFLDTTNPEHILSVSKLIEENTISADEIVVNIISKSGGTTETAANGEVIITLLKNKFKNWKERVIVTTDKASELWESAVALGIDVLEIPKKVGGRYSVFSSVGIFPLLLCNMHVESLLQGAHTMREACLSNTVHNSAAVSAAILFAHLQKGMAINDNFYFQSELESLGKWYRQLMGESTGKMGRGLTPTVSIGSVDLHSVVQLYLGGPKNKVTSFIYTNTVKKCELPTHNTLTHIKEIEGKTVGDILNAIRQGTITAYKKLSLPFTEVVLETIDAREIGAYMQFKMMEIMYLGYLMNINAFDQPQVELYKIETKKILAQK